MNWYSLIKIAQLTPGLQAIADKWTAQGITLFVFEKDDKIILSSLIVPKDMRKQGIGTQIMQELVSYADSLGKRFELTPGLRDSYQGTTSRGRLVNFYKRFGFIENKGRNKDYSTSEGMYRYPSMNKKER